MEIYDLCPHSFLFAYLSFSVNQQFLRLITLASVSKLLIVKMEGRLVFILLTISFAMAQVKKTDLMKNISTQVLNKVEKGEITPQEQYLLDTLTTELNKRMLQANGGEKIDVDKLTADMKNGKEVDKKVKHHFYFYSKEKLKPHLFLDI